MRDPVALIFGKSFTGKTARMLHELREEPRVVLVDPKCSQLAKLRGWEHLWGVYDENARLWIEKDIPGFFQIHRRAEFRVVVHFRNAHREQLELLCRLVLALKNCVLAVDELGLFIPPGAAASLPPNVTAVVVSGTHDGIYFVGTGQRPSLVHGTARANASRMLFYRVTEHYDLDILRNYLPDFLLSKVQELPDYVCVDWADSRPAFLDYSLVGRLNSLPGSRQS